MVVIGDALRLLLFPALMAFAATSDLVTMTISNRISIALAAAFLILAVVTGMTPVAIGWHLAAGVLVLAFGFAFFAFGWIGGGDAKLAAAIALWLGFDYLLPYLVYASLLGGLLTFAMIQFRLFPLPKILARPWIMRLHEKDAGVPYGIALAAAALLVYPQTGWMSALAH
ncbi:MAG: Type IV prepilin peptidase TadV/CpaA [Pseudolabrys sp.]|jgi:prepilin peptidase CpaA|nr:Type IV prepilin peptidase TadV/CpaA [Pseudolabrys sp.]